MEVPVPGSHDIYIVQTLRPHRALSEEFSREVRVVLSKVLSFDPYSLIVGSDFDYRKLVETGQITRMLLTGEITQR